MPGSIDGIITIEDVIAREILGTQKRTNRRNLHNIVGTASTSPHSTIQYKERSRIYGG
jgi:hypothetical protein